MRMSKDHNLYIILLHFSRRYFFKCAPHTSLDSLSVPQSSRLQADDLLTLTFLPCRTVPLTDAL